MKEENLSKEFINLFNKILLNDFNYQNLFLDDNLIEDNYYKRIINDPWFEGIKIGDVLSNNNNCYDFVKKEFQLRYESIKQVNNYEIHLPINDSFSLDDEGINNLYLGNVRSLDYNHILQKIHSEHN